MATENLAQDGVPPVITVTDTVEVVIKREQPEPHRAFRDDGTVQAFFDWQHDNGVYPRRGGSSGPGFFHGVFDAEHADALRAWAQEHGGNRVSSDNDASASERGGL